MGSYCLLVQVGLWSDVGANNVVLWEWVADSGVGVAEVSVAPLRCCAEADLLLLCRLFRKCGGALLSQPSGAADGSSVEEVADMAVH